MTFRARLTLFFLLIVVVPMLAVGVLVFPLIADNENGKADAPVAAAQTAASRLYKHFRERAAARLPQVARDLELTRALRDGNLRAARVRAMALRRSLGLTRIVLRDGGRTVLDLGDPTAIAPARSTLVGPRRTSLGLLEVSALTAPGYVRRFKEASPLGAVVREGDRPLTTTVTGRVPKALPHHGKVDIGSTTYRVASFEAPGFGDPPVRVSVLDADRTGSAVARGRAIAAGVLLGFLLMACAFAIAVSRALQAQVARLLAAARRVAAGDFSTAISVEGRDEFAQLGEEFNKMSHQLKTRLDELRQERTRLEESNRRIGDIFASNLDREALLAIIVRTAIDGLGADAGRASVRTHDGGLEQRAAAGNVAACQNAMQTVETSALRSRRPEVLVGNHNALAAPLTGTDNAELGMVTVARRQPPFSQAERNQFDYLTRQASVSLENVGLHELVASQAVTDDLTGLFNYRRFQEVMEREVPRSKRLDQQLGLLILDIDDFKQVNDRFGHLQGNRVLQAVAQVLRDSSREIDEPARYGGEELAVALPGTDLEGTFRLAERVRERIAALAIASTDGPGIMRVTASLGVAAMPDCADDKDELVAAADAAMRRAKRAGKNRTERAPMRRPQEGLG